MKTISQEAFDYAAQQRTSRSEYAAFIAGVEFAQRWIDVKDELPEAHQTVLIKYEGCHTFLTGFMIEADSWMTCEGMDENIKPTHWRHIELK